MLKLCIRNKVDLSFFSPLMLLSQDANKRQAVRKRSQCRRGQRWGLTFLRGLSFKFHLPGFYTGGGGGGRESVYIPLGLLSFPHGDIFSKIRMHQVIVTKKNRLEEERTK